MHLAARLEALCFARHRLRAVEARQGVQARRQVARAAAAVHLELADARAQLVRVAGNQMEEPHPVVQQDTGVTRDASRAERIAQTLDAASNLRAQDRMKQLASSPRLIIPGHDPAVFTRFPVPGNGVAKIE